MQTPETVLNKLTIQDKALFAWVGHLEVKDEATQKNAENLFISARHAEKRAKEKQTELLEPIKEADKRIRELFKPYLDKLSLCISRISTLLNTYRATQERIAKEEQEYRMAELAAKVAESKETGEVVDLPLEAVQSPRKTSRPEMGTVTYRDAFGIQIVNPDLVPRDLCEPSLSKIRARVKSGIVDIPGVLVTKTYTTVAKSQ